MKLTVRTFVFTILVSHATLLFALEPAGDSLRGWHILSATWNDKHPLDFMTIEWEYFMIHDYEGKFTGTIGYVITNPRSKGGPAANLVVPQGGNVAIGGQVYGRQAIGDYINFGSDHLLANGDNKQTYFEAEKSGYWAQITPEAGTVPLLHLQGQSEHFAWDLTVQEGTPELLARARETGQSFSPVSDTRAMGHIQGETWTVDAIWPRTDVAGTIKVLDTGEVLSIKGKGYRENSWGRYAMPLDGWDFLSFHEYKEDGVVAILQTYHQSKDLDYLDLGFRDAGELKTLRFTTKDGQLKWKHHLWNFAWRPFQCVPMDWDIVAENADYRLELTADISAEAQDPFLSNAALGTRIFFIQEQYPQVRGKIYRKIDGSVVSTFAGQAGGEFAVHKSLRGVRPQTECQKWGTKFQSP